MDQIQTTASSKKRPKRKILEVAALAAEPEPQDREDSGAPDLPPELALARATLIVPTVWRESGYLVLLHSVQDEQVRYLSTYHCDVKVTTVSNFKRMFTEQHDNVDPVHLAISLITRKRIDGTFDMPVRDERKLLAMLTKEELMKLSERELGRAYAAVMGSGPARIKVEQREAKIAEMLAKAATEAASVTEEEKKEQRKKEKKAKREKKIKAPKVPKEPKPPRERATSRTAKRAAEGENPFRAGTMKHAAYQFFLKVNGDKAKSIAQMMEAGAKEASAKSWYSVFVKTAPVSSAPEK